MTRPIVCGVDGSDSAAAALATADWLAERLDARVIALHTAGLATEPGSALRGLEEAVDASEPRRQPEIRVEHGDPPQRLRATAEQENAVLTVVGSRGLGSVQSWLEDSVSRELVKSSDRPFVVVPARAVVPGRAAVARTLVCGVDGSEGSERATALASWLAPALGLRLLIAHAYSPAKSLSAIPAATGISPAHHNQLEDLAKRGAVRVLEGAAIATEGEGEINPRMLVGEPAACLSDLAIRERAAMIVVGSRGRGPLASAVFGSVATSLIEDAPVPVVVSPNRA